MWWLLIPAGLGALLLIVAIHDVFQRREAILHNYPVVGHFRAIANGLGPKIRQYFVARNDEERPFTRDERRWIYTSADKANNYFGFGTDNDIESTSNYIIIKHSAFRSRTPIRIRYGRFQPLS